MTTQLSRRRFLQQTGALSGASVVGAPLLFNLSAMADAAAATASDYKALVCVFLFGGNDSFNMVLPLDAASVATSAAVRPGLALGDAIQRITPTKVNSAANTQEYGLHPSMGKLKALFDNSKLAILANVGPMVGPITKEQFYAGLNIPTALQSHNDQTSTWQSGSTEGAVIGWGGGLEQTLQPVTTDVLSAFRSVSLSGSAVFGATETLAPYNMAPYGSGAVPINTWRTGLGSAAISAFANVRTEGSNSLLELDYAAMVQRSIDAAQYLETNIVQGTDDAYPALPGNGYNVQLGDRLRQVARMIALRSKTAGRQIFFVGLGGFDTHNGQIKEHAQLYAAIDNTFDYFFNRMTTLGMADKVTLFTASDFGRQLNQNRSADLADSAGTDHGWGSHHFVLGGAVLGKQIYGRVPSYTRDATPAYTDPNMIQSYGMMLPQFSVDQYAATLGGWFGVTQSTMVNIMPTLSKYTVQNLGFLAPCTVNGTGVAACLA
jgi:uncharacterized protein (DUF1501 family)